MGQESEAAERALIFRDFQVNQDLFRRARPDAMFLHCLPAHRGDEVTDEVMDGPQSRVWDEAEDRWYTEQALLYMLITGDERGERLG
jgi:ornithine carbamoyltransferase